MAKKALTARLCTTHDQLPERDGPERQAMTWEEARRDDDKTSAKSSLLSLQHTA
jgi:hypothetical protein